MSSLLSLQFVAVVASSFDMTWFKDTQFHQDNIVKINNGFTSCPDWPTLASNAQEGELSIPVLGNTVTKVHIPKSHNMHNITARCINLTLPLDWDSNASNISSIKTIDYFITHIFSSFNPDNMDKNGAFWMLNGGPGGSGTELYPTAIPWLNYINATFDMYLPDHRGTGYSSAVQCPKDIAENATKCIPYLDQIYGDDLLHYSTYAASMDLGYAIDLFINNKSTYEENNTIIYGVSYGTYYLNQYLQLFPDQVNGVIMDGICPPDICRLSIFNENLNEVVIDFMELCNNDTFCRQQFEDDETVVLAMERIFDDIKDNNDSIVPCIPSPVEVQTFRNIMFLLLSDGDKRVLIPPILYRIDRCDEQDKTALANLIIFAEGDVLRLNIMWYGNMLGDNIMLSEMWYGLNASDPGPSYQHMLNMSDDAYAWVDLTTDLRNWWDDWNKYTPDSRIYNKFADPSMPMLLINGDLDPQTPVEYALHSAQGYGANINNNTENALKRYYYTIPNSPHFSMFASPIVNYTDNTMYWDYDFETCAFYIIKSFIDPESDYLPDNQCVHWITPIDWSGDSNLTNVVSAKVFGTEDMWGDDVVSSTTAPTRAAKQDATWMIVSIVFICLCVIALLMICGRFYKRCPVKGEYQAL